MDETDENFKDDLEEEQSEEELFLLYKDGVLYNDVTVESLENGFFYVTPTTIEMGEKLLNFNISQFPENTILTVELKDFWDDFVPTLMIQPMQNHYYKSTKTNDVREVHIIISPDFDDWKFPFNYLDYRKIFNSIVLSDLSKNAEEVKELSFLSEDAEVFTRVNQRDFTFVGNNNSVTVAFTHKFGFDSIVCEVLKYIKISKQLHEETIQHIELENYQKKIVATFTFPNKLKNQCEQYLIYFGEFLKDLGINATSNLKEQAGKVLFSVTPTDDVEALDKVREALAVYLNLPSSPIVYDESFAAMRLKQQIENLEHSQKMAVREIQLSEKVILIQSETIREKNAIISQKDSTIEQQSRIIEKISSKSIMIDSLKNKEEFEKVFDGLEFGESKELKEKLGIKFNPITSLKSLGKQFIGKDVEITSLNLNDETNEKNI